MIYHIASASTGFLEKSRRAGEPCLQLSNPFGPCPTPRACASWRCWRRTNCRSTSCRKSRGMGQSRISTHLGLLQDSGLVQSRREGKRTFYKLEPAGQRRGAANSSNWPSAAPRNCPSTPATRSISSASSPAAANRRRSISTRSPGGSTGSMARAGRGRRSGICCCGFCRRWSWPTSARAKGLLSELLARRCKKVIAVDNSEKIVAFGAAKAKKNGLKNLEFRLGDLQNPPIEPDSVDLVILSQALHHAEEPAKAIAAAYKILKAGGQIMILDLAQAQLREGARALRRPLAGLCRERSASLAGRRRLQEDRNQRRRPRGTAAAFPDDSGQRGKIISQQPR